MTEVTIIQLKNLSPNITGKSGYWDLSGLKPSKKKRQFHLGGVIRTIGEVGNDLEVRKI